MGLDSLAVLISVPLSFAVFYYMWGFGEHLGVRDDAPLGRPNNKIEAFFFWLWFSICGVVMFVVGWGSFAILK